MSERQEHDATKEAGRAVLHDAGREHGSGDHMDALLRYLKGTGQGASSRPAPAQPLEDAQIRARAVDLVLAAGGEVTAVVTASGTLLLRGWVRRRSDTVRLRRSLAGIPGVDHVDVRFRYGIDDVETTQDSTTEPR